jgi:serine/threonine protein kinase
MPRSRLIAVDHSSPPFDRFRSVQRLSADRSGHGSAEHVRHQLYVGRDKQRPESVLVKVTSKPGLVYEQNLNNEIASLSTINRELPDSLYFPVIRDHGRLQDGRVYVVTSLFEELPLASSIGAERASSRLVAHLRTALEVCKALTELHRLEIFHVDLNPMNILYRVEKDKPVIRIVDFESSYERARHSKGLFYDPPTTPGYAAPELSHRAPDARSDLFSLGAVLYTMIATYQWTWDGEVGRSVEADMEIEPDLKRILLHSTEPDADRRYASIQEFRDDLAAYLELIWPGRSW